MHAEDDGATGSTVLRGTGVVLRCLEPDDLAAHLAGEDDDTVRWLTEGRRSEQGRTAEWILENQREWVTGGRRRHWGVRDAAGGALVGGVEAHLEPSPLRTDRGRLLVNLSYAVFPSWRGRGVAARAVELVCAWLPEAFGPCVAVLRIAPGNAPSLRVAHACGFTLRRDGLAALTPDALQDGLLQHERPLDVDDVDPPAPKGRS